MLGAGVASTLARRGTARTRRALGELEAQRQTETEALLDGVKLAFGDLAIDSFTRLGGQMTAQARDQLGQERRLAAEAMKAERTELDHRLRGVLEQVERLRAAVLDAERERGTKLLRLEGELQRSAERTERLVETTRKLADTLGNVRARGAWGERLAEDLLARAGLVEGVSWRRQVTLASGGRPDITFLLPDGAMLHMDVKFPLENYRRSLFAEAGEPRARLVTAFLKDVRERVREVATRGYVAPGEGTLDVALLLIPIEAVFELIAREAPELIDEAIGRGIIPVSPATLVSVLAILRRAATCFRLSREAAALGAGLAELNDAWAAWRQDSDAVQRRLEDAMSAVRQLAASRRARVDRALDQLTGEMAPAQPRTAADPQAALPIGDLPLPTVPDRPGSE